MMACDSNGFNQGANQGKAPFYQYSWSLQDSGWSQLTVYFPGKGDPAFALPSWYQGTSYDFSQAKVGDFQFFVPSSTTQETDYQLEVTAVSLAR